MNSLLTPLLTSPQLPDHVDELRRLLADEAVARERFYAWVDEDKKAEFINGSIVVHSPARLEHTQAQKHLMTLLDAHVRVHGLGVVLYEKAVVKLKRNDYGPDVCFWEKTTGDTFGREQMTFPAPDLVVEVLSPPTAANDRGVKFTDYAANGVREYWIVDPAAGVIEQFDLVGRSYRLRAKLEGSDALTSTVVTGFSVPLDAAFDAAANLSALRKLLA